MARQYNGGFSAPTGFKLDGSTPIDDRLVVNAVGDLTATDVLPFIYTGIIVSVVGDYTYIWNGDDRTEITNWNKIFTGNVDLSTSDVTGNLPLSNITTTNLALLDGSNTFSSTINMSNGLDVTGNIEADTFTIEGFSFYNTNFTSVTGSTIFGSTASGSLPDDNGDLIIDENGDPITLDHDIFPSDLTHSFTGSLFITGGLDLHGPLKVDGLNISTSLRHVTASIVNLTVNQSYATASITSLSGSIETLVTSVAGLVDGTAGFDAVSTNLLPIIIPLEDGGIMLDDEGNDVQTNISEHSIGSSAQKWQNLFAVNTFFGGIHELNLETRGLDQMQEGTVLTLQNGAMHPCETEADPLVMGIVSKGENYPIVLGAEPVLVTGKIEEGDYIITSNIKGHGKGVNPQHIYSQQLFGKIIAQSLEKSKGKSHIIKAMIRKM